MFIYMHCAVECQFNEAIGLDSRAENLGRMIKFSIRSGPSGHHLFLMSSSLIRSGINWLLLSQVNNEQWHVMLTI